MAKAKDPESSSEQLYKLTFHLVNGQELEFEATEDQVQSFQRRHTSYVTRGVDGLEIAGESKLSYGIPLSSILYWTVKYKIQNLTLGLRASSTDE